ncbi:MAG: hypothetical protein QOF25_1755 [Mycobacterium sp.]|nr:hypothetical protein [Mycobacterium sp.]
MHIRDAAKHLHPVGFRATHLPGASRDDRHHVAGRRNLDILVDHLTVGDLRAAFKQPSRRIGERVIRRGNGIGELDVVALVRRAGLPLRAAVDGDDRLGCISAMPTSPRDANA